MGSIEAYLPLADLFDVDLERRRLQADQAEVQAQIDRLETLLGGPFAERAPAAVVDKERARLEDYRVTLVKLGHQLETLDQG